MSGFPPLHWLFHIARWFVEETGKAGGAIGLLGLGYGAWAGWPREYDDLEVSYLGHGAHWHNIIDHSISGEGAVFEFALFTLVGAGAGIAIAYVVRRRRSAGP